MWVANLYDHCAEGSCRFFPRNGRSRHDRGLGHARFPFWGYGKAPPSFCTVGQYNHCADGSCRFFSRNGRSRHDRGLGHARFPFCGYGKAPPSFCTVGQYNHCFSTPVAVIQFVWWLVLFVSQRLLRSSNMLGGWSFLVSLFFYIYIPQSGFLPCRGRRS
uniref:Uncharacterized protein n=1 Tax=Meloidogyne enterolobii TaxID=390850 RepID=A0A6V7XH13_MELEN|nr:unnamed protein product [Meloidogyne enterolobii]